MPIKPKYTLGECRPVMAREFTDRIDLIEAFNIALRAGKRDEPHVLVYYGVGGIGKTSLRRKLCELIESEPTTIRAVVDFGIPSHREQEMALSVLRKTLRDKHKVPFNSFDIAYAVYWQKTRPDAVLKKDTFPLWEEGAIVADVAALLGDAPVIGWIPKLARMAGKGSRILNEWWTKRGKSELRELPGLEAVQIAERLPMFWAADLKDYLTTKGVTAVLFLDTYEALTEGERSEGRLLQHDAWVRELAAQLPEVVWVVCGREKLRWDEADAGWAECLDQHLMGGLAEQDARHFLVSCSVDDTDIQSAIVEGSNGLPYYLDLAVDTYMQITDRGQRQPVPADFARTPTDVFARFLRHLTQAEVETLKVLSVPRFWTRELFKQLVTKLQTGYPVTAFPDLCRFSFINEDAATGTWTMHQLMRQSLRERTVPERVSQLHRVAFEFYDAELRAEEMVDITSKREAALKEALYHGSNVLKPRELVDWFYPLYSAIIEGVKPDFLLALAEQVAVQVESSVEHEEIDLAHSLAMLGIAHTQLASWSEAERCLTRAVELAAPEIQSGQRAGTRVLLNLIDLYTLRGDDASAEPLLQKALALQEHAAAPDRQVMGFVLRGLGNIAKDTGQYQEAVDCFRRALQCAHEVNYRRLVVQCQTCLAIAYAEQGRYAEAEESFRQILTADQQLLGVSSVRVLDDQENLAEVCRSQGKYAEAEPLYELALAGEERVYGEVHPRVARPLASLAELYMAQGLVSEAEPRASRALEIRSETLASDNYELADSLRIVAQVHLARGELVEAERNVQAALRILEKVSSGGTPYFALALGLAGQVRQAQLRHEEAEGYFRHALAMTEKVMGTGHPEVAKVLDSFAGLYGAMGKAEEAAALAARAEAIRVKRD